MTGPSQEPPQPQSKPQPKRALSPAELARASMANAGSPTGTLRPTVSVEEKYLGTTKAEQQKVAHKGKVSALLYGAPVVIVVSIVGALVFRHDLRDEQLIAVLIAGITIGLGGLFEGLYLRHAGAGRVRKNLVHFLCMMGGLVLALPIAFLLMIVFVGRR